MNRDHLRFAKNAASNVVNGSVAAIVSIILPHFFVHDLSPTEFTLWILLLQLGAFVSFLNFGLQVAIGRYVAVALGRGDKAKAETIIGAGVQILSALGMIGMALICIVAWALPFIFRQMQPSLLPLARISLLWIGGALALGLPASGILGALIGLQRNEVPAIINVVGKILLGVVLIWLAARTHSLLVVAQGFFAVSFFVYLLQIAAFRYVCRDWRLPLGRGLAAERWELASYCLSLTVWAVSMLMVGGLDTTIVGIFDYRSVAAYGLALTVGNYFVGSFEALLTPLIQVFARGHAREDVGAIVRLLNTASFLCTLGLVLSGIWMVGLAKFGFTLWVGPSLACQALPLFMILVLANVIRNLVSPYALYLIASGQQQRVLLTPLMEGASNLIFSILGAWLFGAIGVAAGTLIGAVVGIIGHFLYNMRRTLPSSFNRLIFFRNNIGLPFCLALPCLGAVIYGSVNQVVQWTVCDLLIGSVVIAWPAWKVYKLRISAP
jgi:O-antigen/teichoic acid export membrane protein